MNLKTILKNPSYELFLDTSEVIAIKITDFEYCYLVHIYLKCSQNPIEIKCDAKEKDDILNLIKNS